jgi:hypothetical protein
MRRVPQPSSRPRRGIGALVVVMMLFFIMSLVAAYASRNLIFEQRTSANNYRATQAFEAAEAGLEWGIAMLNGGRIDAACRSTADTTQGTFRERYLAMDANGVLQSHKWVDSGTVTDLLPTCIRREAPDSTDGWWSCSCPANGNPVITAPSGTATAPAFQLRFEALGGPMVRVRVQACSTYGARCFDPTGRRSDAIAEINAIVGLANSVTQTPAAALTVRGNLVATEARVANPDGVVVNAGGTVDLDPLLLSGPAGSPPRVAQMDTSLSGMTSAGAMTRGEMMFLATFGMAPQTYRNQPAVVRLSCGADCTAELQDAGQRFPGRVIWVDGDLNLTLNTPLTLGSAAAPALLIVGGNMNIGNAADVSIQGLVYSRGASWTQGTGPAVVRGAFIAEGDAAPNEGSFTITGAPTLLFDSAVVDRLKQVQVRKLPDFGSIVRVPGAWRDF